MKVTDRLLLSPPQPFLHPANRKEHCASLEQGKPVSQQSDTLSPGTVCTLSVGSHPLRKPKLLFLGYWGTIQIALTCKKQKSGLTDS